MLLWFFLGESIGIAGVHMGVLSRIGIALDSDLLKRFDRLIGQRGYTNRSEAFRDLIRDQLVTEQTAAPAATVVGTITLIYDHHGHGVSERLTELQHANHQLVVSTSHAHLDHDSCLEVLIVHGESAAVTQFADRLIGLKGVQHGKLVMTVPAHAIKHRRDDQHKPGPQHSHKH
jgi:CopG family nickel-responsive transcriptional regulator